LQSVYLRNYGLKIWGIWVKFPRRTQNIFLVAAFKLGLSSHTAPYPQGTGTPYLWRWSGRREELTAQLLQ